MTSLDKHSRMAAYLGDKKRIWPASVMPLARRRAVSWIGQRLVAATGWDSDKDDGHGEHGETLAGLELANSGLSARRRCHRQTRLSTRSMMIAIGTLLLAALIIQPIEVVMDDNDQQHRQKQQQQQQQRSRRQRLKRDDQDSASHGDDRSPILVDTKFWIGSTEFASNFNWLDQKRPCSLLERIAIGEEGVVISLDHNSDNAHYAKPLEPATIHELLLANNGLLLLPSSTAGASHDGGQAEEWEDCVESATLKHEPDSPLDHHDQPFRFVFQMDPHDSSWFNRRNWLSVANYDDVAELVPDSHKVPCNEDSVVIGSHLVSWLGDINETAIPFKVHFRPKRGLQSDKDDTAKETISTGENKLRQAAIGSSQSTLVDTLRVSKLVIGDKVYTNEELDQLLGLYEDNLFDFNDEKSIFNLATMSANLSIENDYRSQRGARQRTLNVDQSSVLEGDSGELDYCLEGAGCMCGNEQPALMEAICSFARQPKPADMLCLDPIRAQGYCFPICGTSLTINMVPSKFSESYLVGLVHKIMSGEIEGYEWPSSEQADEHLLVVPRRIDHTRYELTTRLTAVDANHYQGILGKDLLLAQLIKRELERAAVKSFYGIKSINIRSSVVWRQDSRNKIFWAAYIVTISLLIALLVYYDHLLPDIFATLQAESLVRRFETRPASDTNELSFISVDEQSSEFRAEAASAVYLELDATRQELALTELDARSITGSTCGLLDQ